jgi:hypothetical protein
MATVADSAPCLGEVVAERPGHAVAHVLD